MEQEFAPVPDKRQIILMVSQSCNLSCRYCYQSHKSPGLMSVAVARHILEDELARMGYDGHTARAEIAFMGGEPLLNFGLIRDISEWLWSQQPVVPCQLTIRTNGTLLSPDMERWFSANRSRIDVGLSMDGLSRMNRLNRTDQSVNWTFFRENWPERRTRIVLFSDSVQLLAETVREMNRATVPFEAVIGEGFAWSPETAGILEHQLVELVPDYLGHPDEAVRCGLFSFRIGDFFPAHPIRSIPICGAANNMIAYDIDGSPCICHLFSTPVLGYQGARRAWADLRDIPPVPFDPYCTDCPIHKNCKNCFGENQRLCGTVYRTASRMTICNAMRAKARACSFFFLKETERRIGEGAHLSRDEQKDAEKALRLLDAISPFPRS